MTDTQVSPAARVAPREPWITEPGVYTDVTATEYHYDPVVGGSLTSTAVRAMTPPTGCPAKARHYLDSGRTPRGYFDVGSAYHVRTLGRGGEIVVVDAKNWQTKAAQEARRAAYAEGKIPLLSDEAKMVADMVQATMDHELIGPLFRPGEFTPEFVLVWPDPDTGLMCRAMIDAVPHYARRMLMVDLKTKAGDVDPDSIANAIARYGYDAQFAFYRAGARVLNLADEIIPIVVFISKDPPHIITYRRLDENTLAGAELRNRAALDRFATCMENDYWPGYDDPRQSPEIPVARLPRWAEYQYDRAAEAGVYDTTGDLF